jgi:hypothetical protein
VTYLGQTNRIAPLSFFWDVWATKWPTALASEIDCDQTTPSLPPVTSDLFLIAKLFWQNQKYLRCVCYTFGDKAWSESLPDVNLPLELKNHKCFSVSLSRCNAQCGPCLTVRAHLCYFLFSNFSFRYSMTLRPNQKRSLKSERFPKPANDHVYLLFYFIYSEQKNDDFSRGWPKNKWMSCEKMTWE